MSHLRSLTWSLGLLVLLTPLGAVRAAAPATAPQAQKGPQDQPVFSFVERWNHLLLPGAQDKLNLTAQQLDQFNKLQDQFRAQRRDVLIKIAEHVANKCQKQDEDGVAHFDVCQGALTIFTGLVRLRGVRDDFEAKARDLMTAEQKKEYAHLESEWLHRFAGHRAEPLHGRRVDGEWQAFYPVWQEQMKLTAEQRQKLHELRQDTDAKVKSILTDEQYQHLQQRQQFPGGEERLQVKPSNRVPQEKRKPVQDQQPLK